MLDHCREPWRLRVSEDGQVEVLDASGRVFLFLDADGTLEELVANAARLMVCVNFCSGQSIRDLEQVTRSRQHRMEGDKAA